MVIVCDLGNSNVVFATFVNDKMVDSFRLVSNRLSDVDEYVVKLLAILESKKIDISSVDGAILSSVTPSLTKIISEAIEKVFKVTPLLLKPGLKTKLAIRTDNPVEVGSDLIASCVGAVKKYGKPLILVDLGTATKINVIDKNGSFVGTVIAPGLKISYESLVKAAPQLPIISYQAPNQVIGKNTFDSLNSAAIYGTCSMIEGMVRRIERELGYSTIHVITGGLEEYVYPYLETPFMVDDDIILEGLYHIYQINNK